MSLPIGRETAVSGARIAGVVSCVPSRQLTNAHFGEMFGQDKVDDVIKMIGVQTRRWTDATTTTRDLCRNAGLHLLAGLGWEADSVDALIFVSQTPDFRLPATACALQADLGISPNCIAFDINLGCSGYPYALWLGMTMVQTGAARRVLLAVGDTISKIVDPSDRATALLFGDAGTVTAIEAGEADERAHFILGSDGRGATNLIVPKGGFKDYSLSNDPRLADKDAACLYMDGGQIFNFTLRSVPPLVARTAEYAGTPIEEHDYFLFHQANLFMLKHLAKKAKLAPEKTPFNIDQYGNTSCASIPLLMTTSIAEQLKTRRCKLGLIGFGVGYSWASASLSVGPLAVAETIEQ
jgi:3-oxoacyl-[acyl-carrier-protein] synthase-3